MVMAVVTTKKCPACGLPLPEHSEGKAFCPVCGMPLWLHEGDLVVYQPLDAETVALLINLLDNFEISDDPFWKEEAVLVRREIEAHRAAVGKVCIVVSPGGEFSPVTVSYKGVPFPVSADHLELEEQK